MALRRPARPRAGLLALLASGALMLGAAPCGAEDVDAPPDPPLPEAVCTPVGELAPTFFSLLRAGGFEGLRQVVEEALSVCTAGGQPISCTDPRADLPPAALIISHFFVTAGSFARDAPEVRAGSLPGDPGYCAVAGAEPYPPNRLCNVRRGLDALILERDESGRVVLVASVDALQPLLANLLRYVSGELDGGAPRFETLPVLRTILRRCQPETFVDLVHAILVWAGPPRAEQAMDALTALAQNPDSEAFLGQYDFENDVGRSGFVALGRVATDLVRDEDFTPSRLDQLMEDFVYPAVRDKYPDNDLEGDLRRGVAVLNDLLEPAREPSVLRPLQAVLDCGADADPAEAVLGAAYDLWIAGDSFALDGIFEALGDLARADPDGTVLGASDMLIMEMARSPEVRYAVRELLIVFLTEAYAEKLVPVGVTLLESDVVGELVSVADQLLSGCQAEEERP